MDSHACQVRVQFTARSMSVLVVIIHIASYSTQRRDERTTETKEHVNIQHSDHGQVILTNLEAGKMKSAITILR